MSNTNHSEAMSLKTEAEIKSIIDDQNNDYNMRQAAKWELENRASSNSQSRGNMSKEFTTNDSNAIALYSKNAIKGFSFFFSTMFGAVLLMSNLKGMQNSKGRIWVLIFGITYTALTVFAINSLEVNTNLAIPLNMFGALILGELFWNKQIGKEYAYRKKKIWKPLLISLIVIIPFVLAIIYGQ